MIEATNLSLSLSLSLSIYLSIYLSISLSLSLSLSRASSLHFSSSVGGFIEPAAADDSESPCFLTKRTECISISGDIPRKGRAGRIHRGDFRLRGELVSLITVSGS